MKNKKGKKNNFEKFQNATDKSKGLLKNTFGTLFSFIENISGTSKNRAENDEIISCNETSLNDLDTMNNSKGNDKFVMYEEDKQENEDMENIVQNKIKENITEQEKDINILKNEFKKAGVKDKRSVLVNGIHNYLSNTINIEINSLVLNDRMTEIFCSTIILNNRLRGIRRIIRKENKNIEYINNSFQTNSEILCLEKVKEIIEDSIDQIKNLKQEFIMEFYYDMDRYPETEDIMTEFSSIEYQITSKEREIENI